MMIQGSWADVTRTGLVVRELGTPEAPGGLLIGDVHIDTPEWLLCVRSDEGPHGVVVVGQGHQTGNGWVYVQSRGWRSVGPTFGVSPLETNGDQVSCVHSVHEWRVYSLPDFGVHARGEVPNGSTQGWSDCTDPSLLWADLARLVGAVYLPQRAGDWLVGQHPDRLAIVAQRCAEPARLVADGVTAFEPRACVLSDGHIRVVSRTPQGVYCADHDPATWPLLTDPEPQPQPEPEPEPEPEPDPEPDMSMLDTLNRLRAAYGATMSDDQCVELCNAACWEHQADGYGLSRKEAGTRGRRYDGQECCHDVIMLRDGTYWDCLAGAGAQSTPTWGSASGRITDPARGWVAPIAPRGQTPPPPDPQKPPPVTTTITAEQIKAIVVEALRESERVLSGPIAEMAGQVAVLADRVEALAQQTPTQPAVAQPWPVTATLKFRGYAARLFGTEHEIVGKVGA